MTLGDAEGLVQQREGGGFVDYQGVFDPFIDPDLLASNPISETSDYFQLLAVVQIDTVRVSLFTTLYRNPRGDVIPILRKLGTI